MSGVWLKIVPSALSGMRMLIGFAFPWLPVEWRFPAAVVGAVSDLIDGPISRWLRVDGKFGQILDPIADKVFLAGVLVTVVLDDRLPWWEIAAVGIRDGAVLLASGVIAIRDSVGAWKQMQPRLLGKMTTATQAGFVLAFCWDAAILTHGFAMAAALLGAAAIIDYVVAYRKREVDSQKNTPPPPNPPGSPPPN